MIESNALMQRCFRAFVILSVLIMAGSCSPKSAQAPGLEGDADTLAADTAAHKELREVTFLPYWVSTAQFAGYFVAKEKGIYEKYGIKMEIIPYKPFVTSTDLISQGQADFAALWLVNAIELKAKGTDIVNIAQPSSRSSAMLITKKSSGIDSIQKMNGKRAAIWSGFEMQPSALFRKYNLDVKIIPIGSSNNLFLMGGADIIMANWFDEYHSLINSGFDPEDLNVFFFADHGLNFLEDGIYCLSDKLKNDPGLCADFVNATLEGWRYAFSHPDEAVDIVIGYAKKDRLPVNRVHQTWMLDRYRDLYLPEGKTEFHNDLSQKDYEFVGQVLLENHLIDQVPAFETFYQPVIKK